MTRIISLWVNWEKALAEKKNGGLGIGSMEDLNKALLAKWFWRYKTEEGSLWVKVIDSIHGKVNNIEKKKLDQKWKYVETNSETVG